MGSRNPHGLRAKLTAFARPDPPAHPAPPHELIELKARLDRVLYLVENNHRAVDEGLAAILERLRRLEARYEAESAREGSATNP
jgi:hypothetical protein